MEHTLPSREIITLTRWLSRPHVNSINDAASLEQVFADLSIIQRQSRGSGVDLLCLFGWQAHCGCRFFFQLDWFAGFLAELKINHFQRTEQCLTGRTPVDCTIAEQIGWVPGLHCAGSGDELKRIPASAYLADRFDQVFQRCDLVDYWFVWHWTTPQTKPSNHAQ